MPRLVNRTVFGLSGRTTASSSVYDPQGRPWDFSVAGYPFLSAASEERPLLRGTSPIRKDQQDAEAEPGEQSLTGWWLRSQESFHKGAGVLYQESRVELEPSERFRESMGVDVWTPGEVSLLPATTTLKAGANTTLLAQATDGTDDIVFQASGTALYRVTATGSTTVTWGGTGTITSVEVWDGYYYVTDSTGVWRGTIGGGAGSKLWTLSSPGSVFYKRQGGFALLLVDNNVYDVTVETGAPALPSPILTLKEAAWRWTAACRANNTLVAAGKAAGISAIWTFTPTISSTGWTFAQSGGGLPRGETVYSLDNYYNSYLVVGTDAGVRFAAYGDGGQFTFGPLTWEVPANGGPVRGLHTIGRFVYAAAENGLADGGSGLVRIDPETEISTGRFAWANDLQAGGTGTMGAVADISGRPVFCMSATGTLIAHSTQLQTSGYLTTGRIRFRTLENKIFKYLRVRTDPIVGTLTVTAIEDDDTESTVVSYSSAGTSPSDEASLPQGIGPVESLALRFTLTRATTTTGPVLRSYQIKALPAPKRQRIFKLPLSCFDVEKAYNGIFLGREGYALERLEALEGAEEAGDFVVFQDFATGSTWLAVIDEIDFRQSAPPARESWGGFLYLTLRTV